MYIFPTGFYSNSLFSALRKSREFAGGKMSSSGSALDLSPLSPHGKFFLPSVSVMWRNKDHQPDLLHRPLNMSGKAVGWIRYHK